MSVFFDTSILVYAFSDHARRDRAQAVLSAGGVISVQVVNEFVDVLRKKQRQRWETVEDALAVIRDRFDRIRPITVETHSSAVALAREHRFEIYDALIVAAALEARCVTLYTEDMQHGRTIGGLTIANPFL